MIETILEWFRPATASLLAYLFIGGIIFPDRAAFTGLFVPGELFVALGVSLRVAASSRCGRSS